MYCFLTDKTADTVLADWGSIKGTMSKIENTASGNTREHVAVYTGESTPISYTANTYSYKYNWLGE